MTIEVLLYHSAMIGAPSATLNAAGGLTALLDACLVNGFNVRTLTEITRSGSTATAVVDGANPYQIGEVIEVAGAAPTAYNGRFRVTGRTTSTVSWQVVGTPASPATGTITARHPAAGWVRSQFAENVVAYRTIAGGLEHWVQVEDNNPFNDSSVSSRVRMAVGLTGLDTGTQLAEQCRINKANNWVLVADGRTVYLVMGQRETFVFGEANSFADVDDYCFVQSRGSNANNTGTVDGTSQQYGRVFPAVSVDTSLTGASFGARVLRSYAQIGPDVLASPAFFRGYSSSTTAAVNNSRLGSGLTSPVDGKVLLFPIVLIERDGVTEGSAGLVYRGQMRGVFSMGGFVSPGNFSNGFTMLDDVVIAGQLRRVAVVRFGDNQGFGNPGPMQMAIELADSWV